MLWGVTSLIGIPTYLLRIYTVVKVNTLIIIAVLKLSLFWKRRAADLKPAKQSGSCIFNGDRNVKTNVLNLTASSDDHKPS